MTSRIGIGYDLHRLVEGRELTLGGVNVKYHMGLEGHSDADVLLHALIDAMLGAAAMRDIGTHFPPGDEKFKDISSLELLKKTREMLGRERWKVVNADSVIIAEEPKLAPYIDRMRHNIAEVLIIPVSRISVKATTTEGLGVCGRGEGIAAQAVVLLEKSSHPGPAGHEAK